MIVNKLSLICIRLGYRQLQCFRRLQQENGSNNNEKDVQKLDTSVNLAGQSRIGLWKFYL